MQQIPAGSELHGSQAPGFVSPHPPRYGDDPPPSSRAAPTRLKKRERTEYSSYPLAKLQRTDDCLPPNGLVDFSLRTEASSLVGKDGGISSLAYVDRFVCVMECEWNDNAERQLDLAVSRTMLAKVVATTADRECLIKFLKLGGLYFLDKWLQEAYRGKHFGNREITEDGEKAVQDLLLALLAALERLPIDNLVLKACPVAKSVNVLRNHKHPDVQRRAKRLLEAWKKRVESEINLVGGRFTGDRSLNSHQQDFGTIFLGPLQACLSDLLGPRGHANEDQGKFASVVSACAPPNKQHKPQSSARSCVADTVMDALDRFGQSAPSMSNSVRRGSPQLSESLRSPLLSREDGMAITDVGKVMAPPRAPESGKVLRSTVSSKVWSNTNGSGVDNCFSVAPTSEMNLDRMKYMKSMSASPLKLNARSTNPEAPLCSSSSMNLQLSGICDDASRSSMRSLSHVVDSDGRSSNASSLSAEPSKGDMQLLANIAASEGSIVSARVADSWTNRSISMRGVAGIQSENGFVPSCSMKNSSVVLPRTFSKFQDGDHFDQVSSNVSSPSETSAQVDIRGCDSNRLFTVPANAFELYDSSHAAVKPLPTCSSDKGRTIGPSIFAPFRTLSQDGMLKPFSQQLAAEVVGESQNHFHAVGRDPVNVQGCAKLNAGSSVNGNLSGIDHRQINHRIQFSDNLGQKNVSNEVPTGGCYDGNAALSCDAQSCSLQELYTVNQSVRTVGAERSPCTAVSTDRPKFDLNEAVRSEVGVYLPSVGALSVPGAAALTPALESNFTVAVAPVAPIAVVAAAKGSFNLPSGTFFPKGEVGWKGSAPTSAFRRAQRRHVSPPAMACIVKHGSDGKIVDFDLNVLATDLGGPEQAVDLTATSSAQTFANEGLNIPSSVVSTPSQRAQNDGPATGVLDLNQVDNVGESQDRKYIDLNSGPMVQDEDVSVTKYPEARPPSLSETNSCGVSGRGPAYPCESIAPMMLPAFALTSSDFPYRMGPAVPWQDSGRPEGNFQYGFLLQNHPALACPVLPSLPTSSHGAAPFGFNSTAPMKSDCGAPLLDCVQDHRIGSIFVPYSSSVNPSLLPSQTPSLPYMTTGMVAQASQQHHEKGFQGRSNFDLNAGPDGIVSGSIKEDRHAAVSVTEQARSWVPMSEMATALKQREQDVCLSVPLGMQGVCVQQYAWR